MYGIRVMTGVHHIVDPMLSRYEGREQQPEAQKELRTTLTTMWQLQGIVAALITTFAFSAYTSQTDPAVLQDKSSF
jgi:hypothetical protein